MPYKDPTIRQQKAREYSAQHYRANRAKRLAADKAWKARNPDKVRAIQKRSRLKHRDKNLPLKRAHMLLPEIQAQTRERDLRRKYGITGVQYDALLTAQNGVCAICQQPETALHVRSPDPAKHRPAVLCVDHDHDTGVVRGLLCKACNNGIGQFRHDPQRLRAAVLYLSEAPPS